VLVINNDGNSAVFGQSSVEDSGTDVTAEGSSTGGACDGDLVAACNGGTEAVTEVTP
jgi:hypothetical protein